MVEEYTVLSEDTAKGQESVARSPVEVDTPLVCSRAEVATADKRTAEVQEEAAEEEVVEEYIPVSEDMVEEQQLVAGPLEVVDKSLVCSREEVTAAEKRTPVVQEEGAVEGYIPVSGDMVEEQWSVAGSLLVVDTPLVCSREEAEAKPPVVVQESAVDHS